MRQARYQFSEHEIPYVVYNVYRLGHEGHVPVVFCTSKIVGCQ